MDLAEAEEFGAFQTGDHAQDARLLAELQVILEADQVVTFGAQVFLAQLYHGVGPAASSRIAQTHGLHRTKTQRVATAARDLLDGEAGFKERRIVRDVRRNGARGDQRVDED